MNHTTENKIIMTTFGDPEPVLDSRHMFDYGFCPKYQMGDDVFFEYPFDILALAKLFRATSHHTSALITKRNVLTSLFVPNDILSRKDFESLMINFLVFGNGFLQIHKNKLGQITQLKSRLAKYTKRGVDDMYWHIDWQQAKRIQYQKNEIIHLYNPDIDQELYAIPDYISSINAILLNESATLFRRKYYQNGAHAGYILYLSDALTTQKDVDSLEQAVKESKGAGNFKNLFMYVPNGKPDGVKVIPLAEVAAKDEFMNIKIASRDDQLAGHRVPPQLMGIVPSNAGGFGDIKKAAEVFYYHEILPIQNLLSDLNHQLGRQVITFKDYNLTKE